MIGDFRNEQQGLMVAVAVGTALGGKPTNREWPTLAERLDEFEKALVAQPPRVDPEEQDLRIALGLRSRRV